MTNERAVSIWFFLRREQSTKVAPEGGEYDAIAPNAEETDRYLTGAGDFLAATERMLGDERP